MLLQLLQLSLLQLWLQNISVWQFYSPEPISRCIRRCSCRDMALRYRFLLMLS